MSFRPAECTSNCPLLSVKIFNLDPYQPRTEAGQASQYIDGVRSHEDDSALMDELGYVSLGSTKQVRLYRFHSTYIREHLMVFLLRDELMVEVELTGVDYAELQKRVDALQELATTVWSSLQR